MPTTCFRVAIHNQIHSTCYYHVSKYVLQASNGAWKLADRWGYRGPGGHLGMGYGDALDEARDLNRKAGWPAGSHEIISLSGTVYFRIQA